VIPRIAPATHNFLFMTKPLSETRKQNRTVKLDLEKKMNNKFTLVRAKTLKEKRSTRYKSQRTPSVSDM